MATFAGFAFRLIGPMMHTDRDKQRETTRALRAARISTFPEWYLAQSYLTAAIAAFAVSLVVGSLFWAIGVEKLGFWLLAVALLGSALVTFLIVRLGFLVVPRMIAQNRAQKIEQEYQSAIVLCYALAKGGISTLEVFRAVSDEKDTYGEISTEFGLVVRDLEVFGQDIITALQAAAQTTPSTTLRGFFEGLGTILASGADPRDFFKRQAEVALDRAEVKTQGELEQAGMLAEVYVSSFLVIPLLLLVVIAGLSSLGNGQEAYIPLIVYGLIPVGTAVYLLMLEVMMPAEPMRVPPPQSLILDDFGLDSLAADHTVLPPQGKAVGQKGDVARRASAIFADFGLFLKKSWQKIRARFIEKPADAIEISGSIALGVVVVGGGFLWYAKPSYTSFVLQVTGLLLFAIIIAAIPVAFFHELRMARTRKVEGALPDVLSKLAGFNERGIGLLQSFQILGRSASGPLEDELKALERDVSWNGNLIAAIRRLRMRVRASRMAKICILLQRAAAATNHMKEVLDIAALDETRTQALKARKRQTLVSYVLVIYLVFGVFLYVTYMVATLFYGDASFAIAAGPNAQGAQAIGSSGMTATQAKLLFFHAVLLQGICSGLVAGRMGEGHLLSGIKHAGILGALAWIVFTFGVV